MGKMMKDLEVLSEIALNLVNRHVDFDERINSVLSLIGSHIDVSRVYIFMDSPDGLTTSNTYEWCNQGIIPQIDELQGIPYEIIPNWRRLMETEGRVFSENISTLPEDLRAILEPQEIKSLLVYPLLMDRVIRGFIGFDENIQIRHWKNRELELLRTICGIIANSYFAELMDRQIREYSDLLEKKVEERTYELEKSLKELNRAQNQLIQQERMASLGQMAAGVAHEINNPTGFVLSNIQTLSEYNAVYNSLLLHYKRIASEKDEKERDRLCEEVTRKKKDEDFAFIQQDIGNLLKESEEGVRRISKIVKGLQTFAKEKYDKKTDVDLSATIESALHIVWNKLKNRIYVNKMIDPLPAVYGSEHQLYQVFVNLFLNAADAIKDRGTITIRGSRTADNSEILIEIEDSGSGISGQHKERVFEPFYSTKDVNQGIGLGLAVAHGIMKAHNGRINIKDIQSKGSCFQLHFPLTKEDRE